MLKNLVVLSLAAAFALGTCYAAQSSSKTTIPVSRTPANDGKQMFVSYCAPCHGVDGKGSGPVSGALKRNPTDLTLLARHNNGNYPAEHVLSILRFGTETTAHGSEQMPIWGPVFSQMDVSAGMAGTKELRLSNLAQYIQSLQAK